MDKYLFAKYKDGGRGDGFYDCWGLVRERLHTNFKTLLFESFGLVSVDNKKLMTEISNEIILHNGFKPCKPKEGAVACVYIGKVLQHVGIVEKIENRLKVLHADKKSGITTHTIRDFNRIYGKVEYITCLD